MSLNGRVSIVIPCYNHGSMLLETLASIERVRNEAIAEVIIVDDGSTDPTTAQVFREIDQSKYMVLHQPNQGLGRARNAGIEIARGEFILPVDSDNLIRSAYITRAVQILVQSPGVGVVYGDAEYFGEKTGRWSVAEFDLRRLVQVNYIDACALYRRSAWDSVGGYDERMPRMGSEDWDFWMRVANRGWQFVKIDETAFDYRVREGSMVADTRVHMARITAHIFEKPEMRLLRLLREEGMEREEANHRLQVVLQSKDYKVGHFILNQGRRLKQFLHGKNAQLARDHDASTKVFHSWL